MSEKGRPETILEFSPSTLEPMKGFTLDFGKFKLRSRLKIWRRVSTCCVATGANTYFALADPGQGALHFYAVLSKKSCTIVYFGPNSRIGVPPLGNPGSTTALNIW